MNQAGYFHDLEEGQGDIREGTFSSVSRAYIGTNRPIYCLYAVYESQVTNNNIIVPIKIINTFDARYIIVIKYDEFLKRLNNKELKTEYQIEYGEVNYRTITLEDSKSFLLGVENPLFYKNPVFKYQQEFRIVVSENLGYTTEKRLFDGMEMEFFKNYNSKRYYFKNDLNEIAKVVQLSDCKIQGNDFLIQINF